MQSESLKLLNASLFFNLTTFGFWDLSPATAAITRSLRATVCYVHRKEKRLQGQVSTANPSSGHDIYTLVWLWVSVFNWQGTSESKRPNCLEPEFFKSLSKRCIFTVNTNKVVFWLTGEPRRKAHNLELRQHGSVSSARPKQSIRVWDRRIIDDC